MTKLTILFIIFSIYVYLIYSKNFHGLCDVVANENVCVDQKYFADYPKIKTLKVVAHVPFIDPTGISMYYTNLKNNLFATIRNDGDLTFSIGCYRIPNDFMYNKFLEYKLEFTGCNTFRADYIDVDNAKYPFDKISENRLILSSVYKVDNFLSFWGCIQSKEYLKDVAAWVLIDDNNFQVDVNYGQHLERFLESVKASGKKYNAYLKREKFQVNNISDNSYSCNATENDLYADVRDTFNKTFRTHLRKDVVEQSVDHTKLKITVAVLAFFGHILFMLAFFVIGYHILIRCFEHE